MTSSLKSLALRAGDDLSAMFEVADQIARSIEATKEQVDAAKAVRRSIASVMAGSTEMRIQVARQRYAKLVALL